MAGNLPSVCGAAKNVRIGEFATGISTYEVSTTMFSL